MKPTQGDLFGPATPAPPPPPAPRPPSLMLVDASGFIFRAYHALPSLMTSRGVPTNATLGFTRMLLKLLRERQPSHVALCFDLDSRRGRLAIDPTYKANREAPPEDLRAQFATIRQVADVLRLPILEHAGWEADDVIATLTRQAREQGVPVEIIASDKDFLQLLAPGVALWDPVKERPIGEAEALERFGVRPDQMRDYQALVGDAIDNIPKVPGIGPKIAAELLARFGTVEELLARRQEVQRPRVREALTQHEAQLRRALQLVSFRADLPVPLELPALERRELKRAEALALFTELEFFRLIQELPAPPPTPLRLDAPVLGEAAAVAPLLAALERSAEVALSLEFHGEPHSAVPQGLLVLTDEGSAAYLPAEVARQVAPALGQALRRAGLKLVVHDGKAALHLMHALGLGEPTLHTDVELLSYLLNPSRKEHALAELARERLRVELPRREPPARGQPAPALDPTALAAEHVARADAALRLARELWIEAEGVGLAPVYTELERPLTPVLARLERRGVAIDLAALQGVAEGVDRSCETLLAEVYRLAGKTFNVGSGPQLSAVLYEELKLPILKRTKTGPSTDAEVLEKLAEQHPLPQAIIDYRNVFKLKSTYLDTLPGLIGADGRIRTTFHQVAAATGRLSSTNPNLQNIPVRTELGRQIRSAFVAPPGWLLLSADYSQVELRLLAHIAGDAGLLEAFAAGDDVHARTAAEVFGVPQAEVTPDQRRAAKMVNYGIAYGLSAHGLATRLDIPPDEAKGIIERYFARFTGIHRYVEETVEAGRRKGYVESLFGRRRYMPELSSKNRSVAMAAERAAINMPIQGTAADLVKRAMLALDAELGGLADQARLLLQVHDELLLEVREDQVEPVTALARRVMSGAAALRVPLVVDVGVGHSWAQAH